MFTDQTAAFQALLPPSAASSSSSASSPITNGSNPSTRASSPLGSGVKKLKTGAKRRKESEQEIKDREEEEAFMREAYRIHEHLSTLRSSLASTRKAYLSLADGPSSSRAGLGRSRGGADTRRSRLRTQRDPGIRNGAGHGADHDHPGKEGNDEDEDEDDTWLNERRDRHVVYMSDKERQEVDMRGKMIVRRCRDRVAELEVGEKARQSRTLPTPSTLLSLLHALAPDPSSSSSSARQAMEPIITAHRASVLWTLNSLLASTSKDLVDLQEERAKRKAERVRMLGDGAEREARVLGLQKEKEREGFFGRALEGITGAASGSAAGPGSGSGSGAGGRATTSSSASQYTRTNGSSLPPDASSSSNPSDPALDPTLSLSPGQILQFDAENSALLTHLSSTLSSVLAAEKSLLEISEMQTQLITHLAQQTELVDTLYEQAVGSVGEMRGAKEQLVKAKERSGEARLFLLVFLVGASLGLLFLDWYS